VKTRRAGFPGACRAAVDRQQLLLTLNRVKDQLRSMRTKKKGTGRHVLDRESCWRAGRRIVTKILVQREARHKTGGEKSLQAKMYQTETRKKNRRGLLGRMNVHD